MRAAFRAIVLMLLCAAPAAAQNMIYFPPPGGGGSSPVGGTCTAEVVTAIAAATAIPTCAKVDLGSMAAQGTLENGGARPATTYIANSTTAQELDIYGVNGGTQDTSFLMAIIPPTVDGGGGMLAVRRGDNLGTKLPFRIAAQGDGLVTMGNESVEEFVVAGSTTTLGARGTNIRSDSVYGFSNTVAGPDIDAIVAGFKYGGAPAVIKASDGSTGYGTLDVLGLDASGTPGASCAVTTPAHITVVNGIVTVCN